MDLKERETKGRSWARNLAGLARTTVPNEYYKVRGYENIEREILRGGLDRAERYCKTALESFEGDGKKRSIYLRELYEGMRTIIYFMQDRLNPADERFPVEEIGRAGRDRARIATVLSNWYKTFSVPEVSQEKAQPPVQVQPKVQEKPAENLETRVSVPEIQASSSQDVGRVKQNNSGLRYLFLLTHGDAYSEVKHNERTDFLSAIGIRDTEDVASRVFDILPQNESITIRSAPTPLLLHCAGFIYETLRNRGKIVDLEVDELLDSDRYEVNEDYLQEMDKNVFRNGERPEDLIVLSSKPIVLSYASYLMDRVPGASEQIAEWEIYPAGGVYFDIKERTVFYISSVKGEERVGKKPEPKPEEDDLPF